MSDVWCFTCATLSYLDRVRVLGQTLRRHHPDWAFCLCLVDEPPDGFTLDLTREPIDRVVRLEELEIPRLRTWMFMHDVVEICTAVKGPMLRHLLACGAQKVVYLAPDIAVFGHLRDVEALLGWHDIVLTPDLLEPETTLAYNLGFFAVANTVEGRRFTQWWSERLLAWRFDDIADGPFTDQRWCDHAPVFFPTLHVLRDPGYNVAIWNVGQRPVTIEQDGSIRAADRPLRLFRFTKIDTIGGVALEQQGRQQRALLELLKWYVDRLASCAADGIPAGWWAYGHYDDGRTIPEWHRVAYRRSPELQARFADPFRSGTGSMCEALESARTAAYVQDAARPHAG
jgi:hypothetical protein